VVTDYSAGATVDVPQIALSSDGSMSTAVWTYSGSKYIIQSRSATTNLLNLQIAAGSATAHASGSDILDVTDNDVATLTVQVVAASVSEADGAGATFATVSRNTDTTSALTVSLESSDTSATTVAGSVEIAAGQSISTTFNLNAVDDAIVDGTQTVTITATATGHADGSDTLDVADEDVPELSVVIAAEMIREGNGLAATTAMVSRNTDTTSELIVTLVSDDTTEATVPAMVTIAAGQSTSAPFSIDAIDDDQVDGTQPVTITASAAAHADGTDTIEVIDDGEISLYVVPLTDGKVVIFEL
jgi:hypothetical protein